NAHILIVDDTVMNLTVAKGLLKKTRVMIDTAMSGEESIELAKEKAYDLILMDQRMPGMDGITAMHHIKDDGNGLNAGTPVICLTADAVSGAREKYLSEGFEDYITKPIDSRALLDALLNYLPKNKIKTVEAKQTEKPAEESVSDKEFSGKLINKKIGIKYCNGDEEFYETLLSEYVSESNEKANLIKETYDSKDWNNYGIHVHSLKSTSKMIGAEELSEMAASLEAAAGKEDTAAIDAGHEKMCILYEDVVNEIAEKFDIKVKDRNENEDIMEFMPE
ncbi:MAG: response regulator, partial [Lachnospiraceae bacterium]|nr:response regulator [Lachnospiraceae bacterium]